MKADLKQDAMAFFEENQGGPCILCGEEANAVAVFIPSDEQVRQLGAFPPGCNVHPVMFYMACTECATTRLAELTLRGEELAMSVRSGLSSADLN